MWRRNTENATCFGSRNLITIYFTLISIRSVRVNRNEIEKQNRRNTKMYKFNCLMKWIIIIIILYKILYVCWAHASWPLFFFFSPKKAFRLPKHNLTRRVTMFRGCCFLLRIVDFCKSLRIKILFFCTRIGLVRITVCASFVWSIPFRIY